MSNIGKYALDNPFLERVSEHVYRDERYYLSRFLDVFKSVLNKDYKYDYLDAEIVKRKISNIVLDIETGYKDIDFDTVSYVEEEDPTYTYNLNAIYEEYVRLDIYKHTGVSYTEFKNMDRVEKTRFLDYVIYKLDCVNIDQELAVGEMNNELNIEDADKKMKLYDF